MVFKLAHVLKTLLELSSLLLMTGTAVHVTTPWVTVFMVHRLANPSSGVSGTAPEHLRRCLQYLRKNHYEFISIDEAIHKAANGTLSRKKWVSFTVDDGFQDQVVAAAQIFREFDCPATYFLVTGLIDGQIWPWDYQLMHIAKHARSRHIEIEIAGKIHHIAMGESTTKNQLLKLGRQCTAGNIHSTIENIAKLSGVTLPSRPPPEMQPASWDDVRDAEKLGMRFGAHSANHYILSQLSDERLQDEIENSVKRVQSECRNPSEVFCYPSGKANEFDTRAIEQVRKLGLKGALSAEPGYFEPESLKRYATYRFAIPRLPLPNNFDEFKLYLSWLQRQRERVAKNPLRKFLK